MLNIPYLFLPTRFGACCDEFIALDRAECFLSLVRILGRKLTGLYSVASMWQKNYG